MKGTQRLVVHGVEQQDSWKGLRVIGDCNCRWCQFEAGRHSAPPCRDLVIKSMKVCYELADVCLAAFYK